MMNEKREEKRADVKVIFLYRDGRAEDNIFPKHEVFLKCQEAGWFGESPVNQISETGRVYRDLVRFQNAQGQQVEFQATFAPYVDRIARMTIPYTAGFYREWVLDCFGIKPKRDLDAKTVLVNCLARDNGDATAALEESINRYSEVALEESLDTKHLDSIPPTIALVDELDLVADPYRAFHYSKPYINGKIRVKYSQTKKEHGFSYAAEQLLIGALNGAVDRDDRTEMAKLGLIFEAASAMLRI